jgi:PEP-CTERM motif
MKLRIIIVAIGLSLPLLFARAQNPVLQITETGENFTDLKAFFNGAPLGVALTGAADAWTVELPAGFSFNNALVGTNYFMPEPENPSLFNEISITQPTFMLFTSEVSSSGTFGTAESNPFTLTNAGTAPSGAFDLEVADSVTTAVPEASSTLSLLGIGLAGLAYFARTRKAAV